MRYMKLIAMIAGLLCLFVPVISQNNFFKDYLPGRYPLTFTQKLPDDVSQRILIVSTRNFNPNRNYSLIRGLHPRYAVFMFVSGVKNDTAFVQPIRSFDEAIPQLPDQDFLIYVDGHGKTFTQAMERGFDISRRFNINLVVFDWPSDYLALRKTAYSADDVSVSFVKTMNSFSAFKQRAFPESSVSLIFHSMGNRILKNISHPKLIQYMPQHLFSNIIINAAAVKSQNHARWVERLNIQKRVYITVNETDFTLRGATILRIAQQLGIGIRNMNAHNAFYTNFSKIATVEHNLFLEKPELEVKNPDIFLFYDMAFHGKEVKLPENAGVQILRPSDKSFLFSDKKSALESP